MDQHLFWKKQPIQQSKTDTVNIITNLEDILKKNNVNINEQIKLPENYSWYSVDPNNEKDINELYLFLYNNYNYSEDVIGCHYTKESLLWYMKTVNYNKEYNLCVKYKNTIVACIIGSIRNMIIFDKKYNVQELSFLCIHKNIRNKRLFPLLYIEIVRRTFYYDKIIIGYCTSPSMLDFKITNIKYYHRPINISKLLDIQFIAKPNNISLKSYEKIYKINNKINFNLQKITENDIRELTDNYNKFYSKFKIYEYLTEEEFKYRFYGCDTVVESYIYKNNNIITNFISIFYTKSRIFNNNKYTDYDIGMIYHYFYDTEENLIKMIEHVLYLMKNKNIDVINCLNQMDNNIFINKLKFEEGSGNINSYFYNLACPEITNNQIAMITL